MATVVFVQLMTVVFGGYVGMIGACVVNKKIQYDNFNTQSRLKISWNVLKDFFKERIHTGVRTRDSYKTQNRVMGWAKVYHLMWFSHSWC